MAKPGKSFRDALTWRRLGYRTIFRNGCVILVEAARGAELRGPEKLWIRGIQGGKWMHEVDLSKGTWTASTVAQLDQRDLPDVINTVRACYCDADVELCDFCAGSRKPTAESLLQDAALHFEIETLEWEISVLEQKLFAARAARDRKRSILRDRI